LKYKNIKLKSCPFCNKTCMTYLTVLCENCGRDIQNRCTAEDDRILDGASRYCKICGEKSLYYTLGLLPQWPVEYNAGE